MRSSVIKEVGNMQVHRRGFSAVLVGVGNLPLKKKYLHQAIKDGGSQVRRERAGLPGTQAHKM